MDEREVMAFLKTQKKAWLKAYHQQKALLQGETTRKGTAKK
jgi:hypothetical protein